MPYLSLFKLLGDIVVFLAILLECISLFSHGKNRFPLCGKLRGVVGEKNHLEKGGSQALVAQLMAWLLFGASRRCYGSRRSCVRLR